MVVIPIKMGTNTVLSLQRLIFREGQDCSPLQWEGARIQQGQKLTEVSNLESYFSNKAQEFQADCLRHCLSDQEILKTVTGLPVEFSDLPPSQCSYIDNTLIFGDEEIQFCEGRDF